MVPRKRTFCAAAERMTSFFICPMIALLSSTANSRTCTWRPFAPPHERNSRSELKNLNSHVASSNRIYFCINFIKQITDCGHWNEREITPIKERQILLTFQNKKRISRNGQPSYRNRYAEPKRKYGSFSGSLQLQFFPLFSAGQTEAQKIPETCERAWKKCTQIVQNGQR